MRSITLCMLLLLAFVTMPPPVHAESMGALADRIVFLVQNERLKEALEASDRFIEQYPSASFGYSAKGNIYLSLYRTEEAIRNYEMALARETNAQYRSINLSNLGSAYWKSNRFQNALRYYEKAMAAYPDSSVDNSMQSAFVFLVLGDENRAEQLYEKIRPNLTKAEEVLSRANAGNAGKTYINAAWLAYQLGRKEDTRDFSKRALDLARNDNYRVIHANYLAAFGKNEEAQETFKRARLTQVRPNIVAMYYVSMGDVEKAERYFTRAYEELETPEQVRIWKNELVRDGMYPVDIWKSVRELHWFRERAQ